MDSDKLPSAQWVSCSSDTAHRIDIKAVCSSVSIKLKDVKVSEFSSFERRKNGVAAEQKNMVVSGLKAGRIKVVWLQTDSGVTVEHTKWFLIRAINDVWVAKRDLQRGTILAPGDLEFASEDVAPLIGVKSLVDSSPLGRYTNKVIRRGAKFTEDMFSPKPLIEVQAQIDLVLKNAGVKITGRGTALTAGMSIGSKILVKFQNNPQSYSGVVINESTVSVNF